MNKKSVTIKAPKYAEGGIVKKEETPEQKLSRYIATYGARGRKMFEDEATEELKKLKINFSSKTKQGYEPTDAVKNTKAALALGSLGTGSGSNPLSYLFNIAGSVYDAGTATRYAVDGNWEMATEDALQAVVGLLPGYKGKLGMKGNKTLTAIEKAYNSALKTGQGASDVSSIKESKFATGGEAGEPTDPLDKEVLDWTRSYVGSDAYKKRLGNFFKYPDVTQRERKNVVNTVKFNTPTPDTRALSYYKHGNDITIGPLGVLDVTLNSPKGANKNLIRQEIVSHELGHATNSNTEVSGSYLNPLEEKFILDRNKAITPARRNEIYQKTKEDTNKFIGDAFTAPEHDLKPGESKSDIDALRFLLNKKGIYDARKGDINQQLLDKAKKDKDVGGSTIFKRLQTNFDDQSIIDIMNKVAKVETYLNSNEGLAAFGGIVGKTIKAKPKKKFAWGGAVASALPAVGNLVTTLLNGKTQPSTQPIINAQAMKNMVTPYDRSQFAMGGQVDDISDEEYQSWLDQMFSSELEAEEEDEYLLADEEQVIEGDDNDENDDEEDKNGFGSYYSGLPDMFAMGGKVKKKTMRKFANGGTVPIEVEDNEVVETPDGQMMQMSGPSHEEGGIDMSVPAGTKIFSDRLTVNGKTMQQRKLAREKLIAKATKALSKNPTDAVTRGTMQRLEEVTQREEAQDMELQKVANTIYNGSGQFAMGGKVKKYAYGDEVTGDPVNDYFAQRLGYSDLQIPYAPGNEPINNLPTSVPMSGVDLDYAGPKTTVPQAPSSALVGSTPTLATNPINQSVDEPTYSDPSSLTLGDYIGLGANAFNAVAPLMNTRNAARATKPEINRFLGFGREAIAANDAAMNFAGTQAANARRDLSTSTGSAMARNRMNAQSINTVRALDTVADINKNRAEADINQGYSAQMINLLNQRGNLTNQRDQMVMSGATARDEREAQNIDNYYSNMAENLVNLGTNVGNIGRELNISKANRDNTALLESMSEFFQFGRDKRGRLVLKNKTNS